MGRVDNDAFLSELTRFFTRSKATGTVYITTKRYTGQTKPKPRGVKDEAESSSDQKMCLIRATLNKKKISTVINSKDVNRFQMAYANLLKAHMDGLKKPERTKSKKSDKKSS
ncbi:signal recognition particle 14 kDa protein-like [Sycon ciliatum]|uniref:signal recognition particle 14 kDa protein-like n=1 Tax=Sycon ciliatum TaxID=27933 RepID=UPI0020AC2ED6|eukprot:scpid22907/ scgid18420/ Signal recognition particle 14 kDa protein; 18 kDa Alu RNA-binding protein